MNRRRPLYVHLGLHKTGTTSIQWALTVARMQLRAQGICFPEAGRLNDIDVAHHELAWSFVERPGVIPAFKGEIAEYPERVKQQIWDAVRAEACADDVRVAVVSSEEFDVLDAAEIQRLGAEFKDWDIVPIVFLRPYLDFIESGYRTAAVYSGFTDGVRAYAAQQRTRLDFLALVRDWSTIAKDGRVVVFDYAADAVQEDVLGTFFDAIGADVGALPPEARQRQNPSVPAFVPECIRFMRLKGCAADEIDRFVANISAFFSIRHGPECYRCLPNDLCEQLEAQYMKLCARFAAEGCALQPGRVGAWRDQHPVDDLVLSLLAMGRCLAKR